MLPLPPPPTTGPFSQGWHREVGPVNTAARGRRPNKTTDQDRQDKFSRLGERRNKQIASPQPQPNLLAAGAPVSQPTGRVPRAAMLLYPPSSAPSDTSEKQIATLALAVQAPPVQRARSREPIDRSQRADGSSNDPVQRDPLADVRSEAQCARQPSPAQPLSPEIHSTASAKSRRHGL